MWKDPQTGKIWIRKGRCTYCGACCSLGCPHLYFVALRDIKKGESFYGVGEDSGNLIALCDIFNTAETVNIPNCVSCTPKVRKEFPKSPLVTPPKCGFYWVDLKGNKWKKPDYSKGVLSDPTYYLTNQGTGYTSLWKLLETAPATADDTTSITFPKGENCWLLVKPGVANTEWYNYPLPDHTIFQSVGWRTDTALNGTFAAGSWTLHLTVITGKYVIPFIEFNIYLFKGSSPDGSDATYIKYWSIDKDTPNGDTVYDFTFTLDAVPETTFSNEYLFLQLILGTSSANQCASATGCLVTVRCNEGAYQSLETTALTVAAQLTINVDKSSGYVGDVFTFTGTLTQNSTPISGATVTLYKDSTSVGSTTTDANGNYSVLWTADSVGSYDFYTEASW